MPAAADHAGPSAPGGTDLEAVLSRAHEEALTLLQDPAASRLDVVSWLSAHIAAFEHAIYPSAKRRIRDGHALLDEDRGVVARLVRALRIAERAHSGDVLASNLNGERLRERLTELVNEYRDIQHRLVSALGQALDAAEAASLAQEYRETLLHAPTRPHPHLHNRMLFRLDAVRDRILDTMDGRHVPVPRVARTPITPGRWGAYLLGQQHPRTDAQPPQR
ncbi:MAG TPA: hypothetical protein VHB69_10580 [Mycobacteriales bacterium]|nr:hypothetical protein [Mycobacteriales bacterium]